MTGVIPPATSRAGNGKVLSRIFRLVLVIAVAIMTLVSVVPRLFEMPPPMMANLAILAIGNAKVR